MSLPRYGALIAAAVTATVPAGAGTRTSRAVTITSANGYTTAIGHVADAYNSANLTEQIYCEVRGYDTYVHGFCYARTEMGTTLQCATLKEPTVRAMFAINESSTVRFSVDNWGQCVGVIIGNGSFTNPKVRQASFDPGTVQ